MKEKNKIFRREKSFLSKKILTHEFLLHGNFLKRKKSDMKFCPICDSQEFQ